MPHSTDTPAPANPLELGSILGQSQAFGLVAGHCSAAQAACLHPLRTTREFRRVTGCWRDFCSCHLGIDGRNADKIIRLWEEFGATYRVPHNIESLQVQRRLFPECCDQERAAAHSAQGVSRYVIEL
ncbi:MAG: hypothetical protein ACLPXM_00715, partial [Terriglobales bacterium]